MTTERGSFDDPGTDPNASGDFAPGTVDAVVGTREDEMTSTGLSDAPPTRSSTAGTTGRGSSRTTASGAGLGSRSGSASSAGSSDTGDRLQEAASGVADRVADTAQQQVGGAVNSQLGRGADILDQVSNAIRRTCDELRDEQPQIADLADTAAQQVERAGEFLRRTDFQGVLRSGEDFARRQPALFLGGAFALGILASRFLKASPQGGGYGRQFGGGFDQGYRGYGGSYAGGPYGAGAYGAASYGAGSYPGGRGVYGGSAGAAGAAGSTYGAGYGTGTGIGPETTGTGTYGAATDTGLGGSTASTPGSGTTSEEGAGRGGV